MDSHALLQFAVVALIAGALLQLWLAVAGHRARRHAPGDEVALLAQEVKALRVVVTHRAKRTVATGATAPAPGAPVPASDYRDAVSCIRQGAGVKELMAACGMSRGEAELLVRVYGVNGGTPQGAGQVCATSDTL